MKNILFTTLLFLLFNDTFAQSISITPSRVESKHTGTDHILLKGVTTPTIVGLRYGGTLDAPTNTTIDDYLLNIEARGWTNGAGTGFQGAIRFLTTQNWTNANRGNKIDFYTTSNNFNTALRRFTISHNGKVGVGNYILREPDYQFEVNQPDNDDKGIGVYRYGGDVPSFFGISARGVNLLPNSTLNNHVLARFGGKGHDGTNYTLAKARIDMVAIEDWNSTETGAEMKFYTTEINTTNPTVKLQINGNGNIGIGDEAPKAKLVVNGDIQLKKIKIMGNCIDEVFNSINRNGASVIEFASPGGIGCDPGAGGAYDITVKGIEPAEKGTIVTLINNAHTNSIIIIDGNADIPCEYCKIYTPQNSGSGQINLSIYQSVTLMYLGYGWVFISSTN